MAARSRAWQRRIVATVVGTAGIVVPLVQVTPANAASLCAPPADTVAPHVTSLTFNKTSVDLNSGSRKVTVTATAGDASGSATPSGVKTIRGDVAGPRGGAGVVLTLVSGTAVSGTWSGSFTVPEASSPGTWQLEDLYAIDADNNRQDYTRYDTTAQSPTDIRLQQPRWVSTLTITGTPPPPPANVRPGKLSDFTFSPQILDTTKGARTVHITATFHAPYPRKVGLFFERVSGQGRELSARLSPRHGTKGRWVGHLRVLRWQGDSQSRPELYAQYPATVRPQSKNFNDATLSARGFPSVLTIRSAVDKTKPVLTGLTFSPTSIDTTTGAEKVTITATATDSQSGVSRVEADLGIQDAAGGVPSGLYPYAGVGYTSSQYLNVDLKHVGDRWVGTATFGKCIPEGTWMVSVYTNDRAGNYAPYSSKKLTAAGLPGTLSVTSTPGDVDPPAVRDATASGQYGTITVDFTEGVKNVNTNTLSVYPSAPSSTRYQHAATVTAVTCSNGVETVDCSGSRGLATSAVLTVTHLAAGKEYDVWGNLNDVTPQLTDGAGNPLQWDYQATDVTGS